jgi:hypothetical protein
MCTSKKFPSFGRACFLALLFAAGCGGSYNNMTTPPAMPGAQSAQVTLSMTDAPPAGVTVITFEVSVTSATLYPGNVDLLAGKGPVRIEVKKLETESAFLSTASITPASFTQLNLTFANPELTFMNNTGANLAGCANGSVCQIKPTGPLSSTVNGMFNVTSGMQTGLLVDVNLNALLSNALDIDFSSAAAVTVQQQAMQNQGELEDLDGVSGIVASPANNAFMLQTANLGNISVSVDSDTAFGHFENCAAANFSCLSAGQSIDADLNVMATGSFVAKRIELRDDAQDANDDELNGVISKVDTSSQFEIVVTSELRGITNISVGDPIVVTLQTNGGGSKFEVNRDGVDVPSQFQNAFAGAADTSQLIPGQSVQVRKRSMSGGPAPSPVNVITDRVRLVEARFTATVSGAVNGANFNVNNLPGIFAAQGISMIQVQTSQQTNFENGSGVGSLTDGNMVSLRGLLFRNGSSAVLIADKVRRR